METVEPRVAFQETLCYYSFQFPFHPEMWAVEWSTCQSFLDSPILFQVFKIGITGGKGEGKSCETKKGPLLESSWREASADLLGSSSARGCEMPGNIEKRKMSYTASKVQAPCFWVS